MRMCGLGGLLDPNKNVASLSFTQAELCPCCYLYLEVTGDKFQLLSLGPSYLLSHYQHTPGSQKAVLSQISTSAPSYHQALPQDVGSACSFHNQIGVTFIKLDVHQVGAVKEALMRVVGTRNAFV